MASVKLETKSARILCIGLGGAESLTIPPAEGGIAVEMDEGEKERFDKAIATPAVKEWIDAGELVVSDEAETKPAARSPAPPEKKAKHGFFSGSEKDHKGEP